MSHSVKRRIKHIFSLFSQLYVNFPMHNKILHFRNTYIHSNPLLTYHMMLNLPLKDPKTRNSLTLSSNDKMI